MIRHNHLIVRLPAPLEQQRLLADIVYRWTKVLHLLLLSAVTLLVLIGI